MISSTIWNKQARVNSFKDYLWSLKKFTSAHLFQIAREKLCDYVLIIYMKKYEIAYQNFTEAKRASDILRSVKTTAYDQNNNIQ